MTFQETPEAAEPVTPPPDGPPSIPPGPISKPLPRSGGIAIRATGKGSWSVGVPNAKLPAGAYRVRVTTLDRSGNARTLGVRTLRLRP